MESQRQKVILLAESQSTVQFGEALSPHLHLELILLEQWMLMLESYGCACLPGRKRLRRSLSPAHLQAEKDAKLATISHQHARLPSTVKARWNLSRPHFPPTFPLPPPSSPGDPWLRVHRQLHHQSTMAIFPASSQ